MTKITPDNINQAIQKYWGMRAEGFSLSNNDEFADPDNPYRQLLQRKLGLNHSEQKALDVGCGPGFLAIELAKLGYRSTGIDSSEPMLVRARKNARGLVECFLLADAIEAPFTDNSFNVIASRNVVWNLPDPMRAYQTWFRWLKPSGMLIVFDGNHYRYLTDPKRQNASHDQTHKYLGSVDTTIMEAIAKELPMCSHDRPDYDIALLKDIGFINIETVVLRENEEKIEDFAIFCVKP